MPKNIWWFIAGFGIWYTYYSIEIALKGRTMGRNLLLLAPFQCLWEELSWNLPGGHGRCVAYIKKRMAAGDTEHDVFYGKRYSWHYRSIRERNRYAACADDMIPTKLHLLLVVAIPAGIAYLVAAWAGR